MSAKTENYTAEMTVEMVAAYKADPTAATVAVFAEKFGRSVKSVIAKLSREGVYQKAAYVTKNGEKSVSKEDLVGNIAMILGVPADEIGDLVKANKATLKLIVNAFASDEFAN